MKPTGLCTGYCLVSRFLISANVSPGRRCICSTTSCFGIGYLLGLFGWPPCVHALPSDIQLAISFLPCDCALGAGHRRHVDYFAFVLRRLPFGGIPRSVAVLPWGIIAHQPGTVRALAGYADFRRGHYLRYTFLLTGVGMRRRHTPTSVQSST